MCHFESEPPRFGAGLWAAGAGWERWYSPPVAPSECAPSRERAGTAAAPGPESCWDRTPSTLQHLLVRVLQNFDGFPVQRIA